jgi:mannose-6-phosphate isomerase-like protein (cupin superfamily)
MDRLSREILKELLPAEKELAPGTMSGLGQQRTAAGHSDHWSPAILLERAAYLRKLARHGDGAASETLKEYPQHSTMLAFRSRSGGGELHRSFADLFYILDGHATLMVGGELLSPETTAPGEIRGAGVKGGTSQELRAGDVVHIPACKAHQMLVSEGESVTYFVVKIQETP